MRTGKRRPKTYRHIERRHIHSRQANNATTVGALVYQDQTYMGRKRVASARCEQIESEKITGRSTGRSARSSGSAGATAVRLLKEQLEEERTKREKVEKELEELRAIKSRVSSKGKEEEKVEDEELRKFRNFKNQGGVIEP